MLTLISGHTIGRRSSHLRVMRRSSGFIAGAILMTTLLLTSVTYGTILTLGRTVPPFAWSIVCGLLIGLGIAVWAFYYRKTDGTTLWLPRSMASFLASRTKATKSTGEAFSLGVASIVAEILFILAPLAVAAFTLVSLDSTQTLIGLALYIFTASMPLIVVGMMIGGGHKLSRIQKWREANKRFLQFIAGSALIVLGFYLYVEKVLYLTTLSSLGGVL